MSKRAIGYIRTTNNKSAILQKESISEFASLNEIQLIDFVDDLNSLHSVDYCLVMGIERVSRSISEFGTMIQELDQRGIQIVDVKGTLGDSAVLQTRLKAAFKEYERVTMGDRIRKGRAAAKVKRESAS